HDDEVDGAPGGAAQHPRQCRQPRLHRDGRLRRLEPGRAGPVAIPDSPRALRAAGRGGRGGRVPGLGPGGVHLRHGAARARWAMDLTGPGAAGDPKKRSVFVTGQLAKDALQRTLADCGDRFDWTIEALRIKVAALMTTDYIESTLTLPPCDVAYLPGLCQANTETLRRSFGVPFVKGPKDLRDLPAFFGQAAAEYRADGDHALTLLAEINDIHRLRDEEILAIALRHRIAGADVIDLGCSPEHPVKNVGRVVTLLRERGFRVSIDTFNEDEAISADAAGAELLLSL